MTTEAQLKKRFSRFPRQAVLTAVEINEEGSSFKHRAVSNNEDITHDGEVFTRSDINVSPPAFGEELASFNAEIDNSTRIPSRIVLKAKRRIEIRVLVLDTATFTGNVSAGSDSIILDTKNMFVFDRRDLDRLKVRASVKPRAPLSEPLPPQRVDSYLPGASWQ